MSAMSFAARGEVLIVAQAVAVAAALASLAIFGVYLNYGSWGPALRGAVVILAASLLTQAAVLVQLRVLSPDVTLKWYLVPMILGEGMIAGLVGFVAFDSALRYVVLATSALAPLMLMCLRGVEK